MSCETSPHTTGTSQRPPAGFCCHRQFMWPVGTLCCRSAVIFVKMTFLASRLLFSCFFRYFITAVWHWLSLHTRVWRDVPLGCLTCKHHKFGSSIRGALPPWLQGWLFRKKTTQSKLWFQGLSSIHILSLYLPCVCSRCFVSYYCTQTPSLSLFLGFFKDQSLFLRSLVGFELKEATISTFVKKVNKGKKLVIFTPFLHPISTYLRAVFVFSV